MENPTDYKDMVKRLAKKPNDIFTSLSTADMLLLLHLVQFMKNAGIILDEVKKRLIYDKPPKPGTEDRMPKAQADIQAALGDLARLYRVYEGKQELSAEDLIRYDPEKFFEAENLKAIHILHMAIGITGEGCEIMEHLGDVLFEEKPLDEENMLEEHGDLEFYIEGDLQTLGFSREQCLAHNQAKLDTGEKARYKEGYSDEAATERQDKQDDAGEG